MRHTLLLNLVSMRIALGLIVAISITGAFVANDILIGHVRDSFAVMFGSQFVLGALGLYLGNNK